MLPNVEYEQTKSQSMLCRYQTSVQQKKNIQEMFTLVGFQSFYAFHHLRMTDSCQLLRLYQWKREEIKIKWNITINPRHIAIVPIHWFDRKHTKLQFKSNYYYYSFMNRNFRIVFGEPQNQAKSNQEKTNQNALNPFHLLIINLVNWILDNLSE